MASSTANTPSTSGLTALLGANLLTKSGTSPTSDVLNGKVTLLYFSAHWCGPCRQFTPELSKIYQDLVAAGKNIEVVFVSSDKDQGSFDEYYGSMPWCALPFEERDTKAALSKKFKVRGIPTLVVLDEDGSTITTDGRTAVSSDPTGKNFPWRPKSVKELLGDTLTGKDGPVPMSALAGKNLALYFSAHWCPPCRGFTPKLAELYNAMKASGREDFEFIFVSSDRDESAFSEYYGEMPWLALPFEKRDEKNELSSLFGVEGIPTLVTLDSDLNIINKSARGPAGSDPTGAAFPWPPSPLEELSGGVECNGSDVNEATTIIILCDRCDAATQESIKGTFLPVAEDIAAKGKASGEPEFICFIATKPSGPVPQVKKLTNQPDNKDTPTLMILDIPDNGGYYVSPAEEITTETLTSFLEMYRAKALNRLQLS